MSRLGLAGAAVPAPAAAVQVAPTAIGALGDAAVGLRGSSTVVGLHWESIASGATGFGGSLPIAGKVGLEFVQVMVGNASDVEDPHRFQLALASEVPANQAALDAGEALFPQASQAAASKKALVVFGSTKQFWVPVATVVSMRGRRIVCGFYNGAIAACDAYVAIVLHRVIGGEAGGDPSFLSGEPVLDV